jgi:hypothetical protein
MDEWLAIFYPNKDKAEHVANKRIIDASHEWLSKNNIVASLAAYNQCVAPRLNNKLSISDFLIRSHGKALNN